MMSNRWVWFGLIWVIMGIFVGCQKQTSEPQPPKIEYASATVLPEEVSQPVRVEKQGDSLIFQYATLKDVPEFTPDQIVMGTQGGGYLKRVKNVIQQGNTVILITENAALTDAVKQCDIKKTTRLKPTPEVFQKLNTMMKPTDTTITVYDKQKKLYRKFRVQSSEPFFRTATEDGYDWEWVWPRVEIEEEVGLLHFTATIDTVIIAFNVDITVELKIDFFVVKWFKTAFQFDKKLTIGDFMPSFNLQVPNKMIEDIFRHVFYQTPTDFLLGTVTIPAPPIVVSFRMGFNVDTGLNSLQMNANWEFASGMQVQENFMIGVAYEDGVGWYPLYNTNIEGHFAPRFKGFEGQFLVDFDLLKMTMDIKMLAYDLAGPGFSIYVGGYGNLALFRRIFEFGGFLGYDIKAYLSVLGIPLAEQTLTSEQIRYSLYTISWCNLPEEALDNDDDIMGGINQ